MDSSAGVKTLRLESKVKNNHMTMTIKNNKESILDLIEQATLMLQDRSRPEADLIYYIARMDDETRCAIILAYQNLFSD